MQIHGILHEHLLQRTLIEIGNSLSRSHNTTTPPFVEELTRPVTAAEQHDSAVQSTGDIVNEVLSPSTLPVESEFVTRDDEVFVRQAELLQSLREVHDAGIGVEPEQIVRCAEMLSQDSDFFIRRIQSQGVVLFVNEIIALMDAISTINIGG